MLHLLVEGILLVSGLLCLSAYFRAHRACFPPGPRPLPFVGNVLDIRQFSNCSPWKSISNWSKLYGELIYLLDKRAATYSSRPRLVMCNELQGWDYMASLMPYCDEQKRKRQILLRLLRPSVRGQYNHILLDEVRRMLYNTLNNPEKFETYIKHLASATIVRVAYGYEVKTENDPYIDLAGKAIATITESTSFLVNHFPFLKYLPGWLPGTGFLQVAESGRKLAHDVLNLPFTTGKETLMHGHAFPSVMSDMLGGTDNTEGGAVDEELIKAITSVLYIAGSDTTVSFNLSFVLAMVLYREVQKRGQDEVDRILGKGILPTMDDLNKLPYVNAIYYEVLRWNPVTPLLLPHSTIKDDTYNGFSIPANTTVVANIWGMTRDYPDPEIFRPERFLEVNNAARNPELYAFGFGRRRCPGKYFAENLVKLTIASFLAVCDIEKAIGEDGLPITPSVEYTSTAISHPKPFRCISSPRKPGFENS